LKELTRVSIDRWFSTEDIRIRADKLIEAIVDCFGDKFLNGSNSILEVGCGHGRIGRYLKENYKVDITFSDARKLFLDVILEDFPTVKTKQVDLDQGWDFEPIYDIILHIGVLYHLMDPASALRQACTNTKKYLFLETEFADTGDPYLMVCRTGEEENNINHSIHNIGCRPSYGMVERVLEESGLSFRRIMDEKYDSVSHVYTDKIKHTNKIHSKHFRGIWICERI
jgi:cyclopropane fatty-acyl-phospholipid synthase-like methyltransferase